MAVLATDQGADNFALSLGNYCYDHLKSYGETNFACTDQCHISFYQAAHDFPASAWQFNYYYLISRGGWLETFQQGWATVEACKGGLGNSNSTTSTSDQPASASSTSGSTYPTSYTTDPTASGSTPSTISTPTQIPAASGSSPSAATASASAASSVTSSNMGSQVLI